MGIISTLSDLGSIGSTTRWAIKLYQDLKSNNEKIYLSNRRGWIYWI